MAKRMLFMLAVVIVVVAGLGFVKYKQIQTAIAQGSSFAPPPDAVTTVVATLLFAANLLHDRIHFGFARFPV